MTAFQEYATTFRGDTPWVERNAQACGICMFWRYTARYTRLTTKFLAGHTQARMYKRSKNKRRWRFDGALSL